MKRLALLLISSIMALTPLSAAAANAESSTQYPKDSDFIKPLTFASLTDYAVDGDNYAFAENSTVTVFDGSDIEIFTFDNNITSLDFDDGVFYCSDGESVYSLPDKETADYVIPAPRTTIDNGDYNYRLIDNTLKIADYVNETVHTPEGEFSNIKLYADTVYAMKDGEVCKFDGENYEVIELEYYDYTVTQNIFTGTTHTALNNYTLKFVTVASGAHMTRTDLTDLSGEYFVTDVTVTAEKDETALLLCYTGNAALVSIGDNCYIVHKDNTSECTIECKSEPKFDNATVTGNNIYASPYVFIETPALSNATGTIVEVVARLECEGVLGSVFYEVRYSARNGSVQTGYVADGLLTEYIIEDNKEPTVVPDPEFSEKNNTRTVLLVLLVVTLVLVAIGYLAYVGTKNGKKSKNKDKSTPDN